MPDLLELVSAAENSANRVEHILAEVVPAEDTPPIETMERADTPAIWTDFRAKLTQLEATAGTLTVAQPTKDDCALARVTRLSFKSLRVAIEKKRKELGEQYLRKTQKINADAKELEKLITPFEEKLLEIEQYAERQEEARKAALEVAREVTLNEARGTPGSSGAAFNLGEMSEDDFTALIDGLKAQRAAKEAAEAKAEAERLAKEKADAEERERIRVENERLKAEAEARDAEAKAEREAAKKREQALAAAAKKEREEAQARAKAELEEVAAKAEAARVAARKELEEAAAKAKAERDAIEAKAEVEREKAAKDRAEAEEVARKEREAIEARAKAERAEAEEVARKRQEAVEAAARVERDAREKAEAALKAAAQAEEARISAAAEASRKSAAAPDKEKLAAFAEAVRSLPVPELVTDAGKALANELATQTEKFAAWVTKKAATL